MFLSRILAVEHRSLWSKLSLPSKAPAVPSGIQYLRVKEDKTLAYQKLQSSQPRTSAVLYIYGFQASSKSGLEGTKVSFLKQFCLENDYSFIR